MRLGRQRFTLSAHNKTLVATLGSGVDASCQGPEPTTCFFVRRIGFHGQGWFNTRVCPAEDHRRLENAYHQGYIYREMLEDLRERRGRWPFFPVFPGY